MVDRPVNAARLRPLLPTTGFLISSETPIETGKRVLATSPEDAPVESGRPAVVAVGASAGGLKALQQFVEAIPPDSGMAYVVIVHLDPGRESRMAELLQDRTSLPVSKIEGPTTVEADRIYVIPPESDIELRDSTICLRERGERSLHVPIDLFFRTLARTAGPEATGVVLSGTGSDGTEGIRAIRQAGGITAAQAPDDAEYDGMPTSAIATGLIDIVLPSSRIPAELLRIRRSSPLVDLEEDRQERDLEAQLAPIFAALRKWTGHDFSRYRRATFLRRLDRRLRFNRVDGLAQYAPMVQSDGTECRALMQDLLISVSSFFRDPGEFEALEEELPALFQDRGPEDTVRVWVVGCATGEEVYSLAMILSEYTAAMEDPPRIQIFATDIDENGYAWGREGVYPAAAIAEIDPERLRRFFTKEPGGYRISNSLREMVLFAIHDVLGDPPFARMDLIACRNLFIYLRPQAQQRVLETFHYALKPEGLLFLGASESAGGGELFTAAGPHRIFRRRAAAQRVLPPPSAADPLPRTWRPAATGDGDGTTAEISDTTAEDDGSAGTHDAERAPFSYGAIHVQMLERYAHPSLIVDDRWEVVHLSEGAGRFLRLGGGEPSRRVLDLAPEDLRTPLRTALHQALERGQPVTRRVRIDHDGAFRHVSVTARPGVGDGTGAGFALVVFEDDEDEVRDGDGDGAAPAERPLEADRQDLVTLEKELGQTREQLEQERAAHDRTVAELQTANEELRSINEEQRAVTEELETGREEIQAINEELTTINQEHQSTIEELGQTNADLRNLIESTEIGTVFVDREMRIRRFTPKAAEVFNFVSTDRGRPLSDITHRLDYPELVDDVDRTLETLERVEREVESGSGEWFVIRINPYRSQEGEVDGSVVTLFDHSDWHRMEQELREAKAAAERANAEKETFLSTISHELRTPLGAIMGYADVLELGGTLTKEQKQRVERIKAGGRHLDSMIEQVLQFSRLDGGTEKVSPEVVEAAAIAEDVHALVAPLAEKKDLAFQVDLPDGGPILETDPGKLRQILINLCGNAVKYTEAGEVRLRVRADEGRVLFEISDTGIGIEAEHRDRIFERFWQVDGGLTRSGGGLGIGLAAAREFARLLRGGIEVESEPGKGSTFRLWLPGSGADTGTPG